MNIWTKYNVVIQITNELMAGIPKNPDLIKTWLESRKPSDAAFARRASSGEEMPSIEAVAEEVAASVGANMEKDEEVVQAEEEFAWLGFRRDEERGLWVRGSDMKAHLKDGANVLKVLLDVKALRSKVADRVYVEEDAIFFGVMEPTGHIEHPVHVMTRQGKRSALKRNDFIQSPRLEFTLKVLADDVIDEDLLQAMFEYGGLHGFGAERGLGYGRYTLELLEKQEEPSEQTEASSSAAGGDVAASGVKVQENPDGTLNEQAPATTTR